MAVYAVRFDEEKQAALLPAMRALSAPWRRARADAIKPPAGRLRSLAAGLLLDYALRAEGRPPAASVTLGPHGKPLMEGLCFSLAHCRGVAVCALSPEPVGVDAEPFRFLTERLLRRVFTDGERAGAPASGDPDAYFTRLWTLKEALIKARGVGLREGPKGFAFRLCGGHVQGPPGYAYTLFDAIPGVSVALAVRAG